MEKRTESKGERELTHNPKEIERGAEGRGHKQGGLGSHAGSPVHGEHRNVVNTESHGEKLKHS